MPLRPRKVTIFIILYRVLNRIISDNNGTTQWDRCAPLLIRVLPMVESDSDDLTSEQQVVWKAVEAIDTATSISSNPPNFEALNDDLEAACDDAGL